MAAWPYRPDLDCVAETSDGRFASYVLCWYDEANRAGEFEPDAVVLGALRATDPGC